MRVAGLLVLAGLAAAGTAAAADLELKVAGAGAAGKVMLALFDSGATFLKEGQGVAAAVLTARDGAARMVFDLPPGRYAVSVFHDANGNGKLDTNLVGLPTEPYGFSRNARGNMGPPGFDAAAFDLTDAGTSQTINLGD